MKKYLSLILITILFTPNLFGAAEQYEEALKLYNLKEYKKAYNIFSKLAKNKESKRLNFYLGRTSYELGKYNKALEFYTKVLFDDPENLRVRLEIAQTYLQLGKKEKAKDEFTYLLNEEMPQNIKQYIQNTLKNLESNKDYTISNSVFFGLGYDDNIKSTTNTSYSVYVPQLNQNLAVSPEKEISGGSYEFGALSSYTKKLEDDLLLNLNVVGFSQNYFSNTLHHNEMQLFSFGITPIFLNKDSQTSVRFAYDLLWYGHQRYLENLTIAPTFTQKLNQNYINATTFKFAHKSFAQKANNYGDATGSVVNDTQKDSRTYELSNKLSYQSKSTGITSLEIALGKESDLDDVRVDIDKRYGTIGVSNLYPFSNKLSFNSSLKYTRTKFDNYDPNFLKHRSDNTYIGSLGVNYNFTKSTLVSLIYRYTNRSSNFASYDYDKNTIKSTINYKF